MSHSPFTVLFVQGSWHTDYHAQPLIKVFEARGIEAVACTYPSNRVTTSEAPAVDSDPSTWPTEFSTPRPEGDGWPDGHADCAFVDSRLRQLVEGRGATVIVVAHSRGGLIATQCLRPDLALSNRRAGGRTGGVAGVFYIAAFTVPPGYSSYEYLVKYNTTTGETVEDVFDFWPSGLLSLKTPARLLFSESEEASQKELVKAVVSELRAGPVVSYGLKLDHAGYTNVPCAYLMCEADRIMPPALQEEFVQVMKEHGVDVKVWRRPCGHEPAITQPDDTANLIEEFARGILGPVQ